MRVNLERVDYWLAEGAQPSDRVRKLIKQARKEAASLAEAPPGAAQEAPVDEAAGDEAAGEESLAEEAAASQSTEASEA